jgi:signal transduction histidine kinase
MRPTTARLAFVRPRRAVLALSVAAVSLIAWIEITLLVHGQVMPLWTLTLAPITGLVYAFAGAVAWSRRPSNRLGPIMTTGALLWLLVGLANTDVPGLAAVGVVLASTPLAVVVHLLHAFPSGRLRSVLSRWTVTVGYGVCIFLQVPLYLFAPAASPNGMLAATNRPDLATAGSRLQTGTGIAVMVVTAVILGGRLRHTALRQRKVLTPLYFYGIVAVLLVPLVPDVVRPVTGISSAESAAAQAVLLATVPIVFCCAVLLGGFARTSEIQELGAWLGAAGGSRPPLREALASALGDDSVQLAFWVAGRDTYVDGGGQPLPLPEPGSGRGVVEVEIADRLIGAIVYDATLIDEPELVHAAGQVIAIAADQQRLEADLRASERQLQLSRAGVVEAGDRERRRIAQDLHDGLQAELVLLAIEAQRLAGMPGTPRATAEAATRLRVRIDDAAAGLRELVYAVMPAPLIERGLVAATEDLVDRMPVPTHLSVGLDPNDAVPPSVESTAYFVVAEALSNAVRHGNATKIAVHLSYSAQMLVVEIEDDGVGGAHPGKGLGLGGLADRVEVLGGRLHVHSPYGGGTNIVAELPCEL